MHDFISKGLTAWRPWPGGLMRSPPQLPRKRVRMSVAATRVLPRPASTTPCVMSLCVPPDRIDPCGRFAGDGGCGGGLRARAMLSALLTASVAPPAATLSRV